MTFRYIINTLKNFIFLYFRENISERKLQDITSGTYKEVEPGGTILFLVYKFCSVHSPVDGSVPHISFMNTFFTYLLPLPARNWGNLNV